MNLLIEASKSGNLEKVKRLLRDDPKSHDYKDSAFVWACFNGHVEVVRLLLEHGANIHARDEQAMVWVISFDYLEVAKLLVEYGADLSIVERIDNYGPVIEYLKKQLLIKKINEFS
jgi:ankyrin repeat protein